MPKRFPKNPLERGNFGEEDDSGDVLALLDRIRRNYELMEGSVAQEDASFQERITVPDGTQVTVTIRPTSSEKWLLLEHLKIKPPKINVDYTIIADSEEVDTNVFSSDIPTTVQDKIKATTNNFSGAEERFTITMDAREIPKFQG